MRNIQFALLLSALVLATAIACTSNESGPGASGVGSSTASNIKPGRGRELYKANCVACHGEKGKGDGPGAGVLKPPPRDHTDGAYMSTLSDDEIGNIIRMGGAPKGKPLMPSHPQISGNDLASLVAYVRSLSQSGAGH